MRKNNAELRAFVEKKGYAKLKDNEKTYLVKTSEELMKDFDTACELNAADKAKVFRRFMQEYIMQTEKENMVKTNKSRLKKMLSLKPEEQLQELTKLDSALHSIFIDMRKESQKQAGK